MPADRHARRRTRLDDHRRAETRSRRPVRVDRDRRRADRAALGPRPDSCRAPARRRRSSAGPTTPTGCAPRSRHPDGTSHRPTSATAPAGSPASSIPLLGPDPSGPRPGRPAARVVARRRLTLASVYAVGWLIATRRWPPAARAALDPVTRDGDGRVVAADTRRSARLFGYDAAGQLTGAADAARRVPLHYDAAGRLTHRDPSRIRGPAPSLRRRRTAPQSARPAGEHRFGYDACRPPHRRGRRPAHAPLRWDELGRLTAVTATDDAIRAPACTSTPLGELAQVDGTRARPGTAPTRSLAAGLDRRRSADRARPPLGAAGDGTEAPLDPDWQHDVGVHGADRPVGARRRRRRRGDRLSRRARRRRPGLAAQPRLRPGHPGLPARPTRCRRSPGTAYAPTPTTTPATIPSTPSTRSGCARSPTPISLLSALPGITGDRAAGGAGALRPGTRGPIRTGLSPVNGALTAAMSPAASTSEAGGRRPLHQAHRRVPADPCSDNLAQLRQQERVVDPAQFYDDLDHYAAVAATATTCRERRAAGAASKFTPPKIGGGLALAGIGYDIATGKDPVQAAAAGAGVRRLGRRRRRHRLVHPRSRRPRSVPSAVLSSGRSPLVPSTRCSRTAWTSARPRARQGGRDDTAKAIGGGVMKVAEDRAVD